MPILSIEKLLQLAIECEDRHSLSKAEDYLDLAVSCANNDSDIARRRLAYSRFAAFLRRHGRQQDAVTFERLLSEAPPKVSPARVSQKKLLVAKEMIEQLVSAGVIDDEEDAFSKLSDPAWVTTRGLDEMAVLLNTEVVLQACQMVFQRTSSLQAVSET